MTVTSTVDKWVPAKKLEEVMGRFGFKKGTMKGIGTES